MPTTSEPPPLSRIQLVVLASLLQSKSSDATVEDVIEQICMPTEAASARAAAAQAALAELRRRGLVSATELKLTAGGKQVLRSQLGLKQRPTWAQVRDKQLPALALGLLPGSEAATKAIGSQSAIIAAVLCEALGVRDARSPAAVCDALIADRLGMPRGPLTLEAIRAHVLATSADVEPDGKSTELAVRIAVASARAAGLHDNLRQSLAIALGRRWVRGIASPVAASNANRVREPVATEPVRTAAAPAVAAPPPSPTAPRSIDNLLEAVRAAIPRIGAEGRFGSEKVFVSALWHRLDQARRPVDLSLDRFKRWLVDANRDGFLQLARADLVGAMDPKQVAESEIRDRGATFHFVVDAHGGAAPRGGSHVR